MKKHHKDKLHIGHVRETPTFEEWRSKYFSEPKTKVVYKSNMNGEVGKEYTYEQLEARYKRAFKYTGSSLTPVHQSSSKERSYMI